MRGESNVRADPVAIHRAEAVRQPLREPSFHALRRDGDDLRGEWVAAGCDQQRAECVNERVSPLGAVHMQHVVSASSLLVTENRPNGIAGKICLGTVRHAPTGGAGRRPHDLVRLSY